MPHLIIIAGCNGSGKTTAAPALIAAQKNTPELIISNQTVWQTLSETYPEYQ